MPDYKTSSVLLESLLQIKRKPVAVKFLLDEPEFSVFKADKKNNMIVYCNAVARASFGRTFKLEAKNLACSGSARALGFIKPDDDTISGSRRVKNGSYRDLCISRNISTHMVYCQHTIFGIGITPLDKYEHTENPDIILFITDSYDAMRIIQGYAYHYGHAKNIRLAGMQAICQECTSYPFETNDINVSMLCPGTRMLAQWARDEIVIGIPFNKYEMIVDGVLRTVNPFERNDNKKTIEEKLKANDLENVLKIEYNKNYDDGGYTGIGDLINSKENR
jgi:uncharacterized protein (DUF169 family)